ncbi:hypothetical protein KL933_003190 [Ogataea haglerorum]|uniref:Actin interacting protein 3 C-terminal domain-containing protein n=1 Tax=Ogataea haglerorum TaxID=1937702 RepID=A0AAN6D4U7_9ASCO|nr:hypothetical protein KL915_000198 [Ogataea haglerorum]KAG7715253.1 hypothetical protein KL913_004085 [Ogataea haglerorum]KAG7715750.1 hypothetical protein KL949_004167 [Ogataea haglerorum]KAG7726907.1 hypothetical protein KL933_003190 [Ogataea haglerorum]KAG7741704.1 hypothetical protein KL923_000959 [Ogataea haglerorum]
MSSPHQTTPRTSKSPSKRKSVSLPARAANLQTPMSISSATAQLLTSTKALLQSLTAWANKTASVGEVSAKFVQVGDDFKALRRAYVAGGVDTSDVKDIPNLLRKVLEESLILEPSQSTLDMFLPKVGEIVAELMKILKEKQAESQSVAEKRKSQNHRSVSGPANVSASATSPPLPPPPSESQNDAISRLQNNRSLMRKASKRFSAYQTSKIMSMNAISPRNSPAPSEKQTLSPEPPSSPLQAEVSKNIKKSEIHQQLTAPSITLEEAFDSRKTIFVKLEGRIKKAQIQLPTTITQLRTLFTEKFGYVPENEFPPIYIQMSPTDIAYELEDTSEVTDSVIISLLEPDFTTTLMKEMKSQTETLRNEIIKLEANLSGRIGDSRASVVVKEPAVISSDSNLTSTDITTEIETLKTELTKARQLQKALKKRVGAAIEDALELVENFQSSSLSPEGFIGDPYMEQCKRKVSSECENLVTRIDDLQDIIEALKLDISKRGSKPTQKQILHVQKELQMTKTSLSSLLQYMSIERKNWNARWQAELTAVLEEQEFFKEQETIIHLLEEDLSSADDTYALIVKCVEELEKNPKLMRGGSIALPPPDPSVSISQMRNALMDEVLSLKPDHDSRVEAIMKAEKVREKEREILIGNQAQDETAESSEIQGDHRNNNDER